MCPGKVYGQLRKSESTYVAGLITKEYISKTSPSRGMADIHQCLYTTSA
jgi:hypothetical protein